MTFFPSFIVVEVSIGHVKGKILPQYRNIYCASGVVHLIDTVLGIPMRNAYQEIASRPDLSILRSLIDMSSLRPALDQAVPSLNIPVGAYAYSGTQTRLMRQQNQTGSGVVKRQIQPQQQQLPNNQQQQQQLMQQQLLPIQQQQAMQLQNLLQKIGYNQYGYAGQPIVTILAPTDSALVLLKDFAMQQNQSTIDAILSNHVITGNQNVPYYSLHDQNLFANGQTYQTLNPNFAVSANFYSDSRGYPSKP
jgi:uncharacterized surface protein with fasciclin (FAS1) repeats